MVLHREKTRTMVLCAMFVVLIAAGAWIKIPVPVVPFTLQYLFTMLAGILLGGRRGALAVCAYLALGLAGLPIFAQGGGLSYLLQPSFGYLIGFAAGAFVTGTMARSGPVTFRRLLAANLVGAWVVYLFGMLYYYGICQALGTPIGFWPAVSVWICAGRPRGFGAVCGGGCFGHAPASRHSKGEKSMTVTETLGRKVLAGGQLTRKRP